MNKGERKEGSEADRKLAAKNMRLAIILGLVAAGIYVGYILLMSWK